MKTILFAAALALLAACGSNSSPADAGPILTSSGCYLNPATNDEIINACTDAGFVDVNPVLPLLLPDGGLPDLP